MVEEPLHNSLLRGFAAFAQLAAGAGAVVENKTSQGLQRVISKEICWAEQGGPRRGFRNGSKHRTWRKAMDAGMTAQLTEDQERDLMTALMPQRQVSEQL